MRLLPISSGSLLIIFWSIDLASAWEALFVYDSILFSLTTFKTWKNRDRIILNQAKNTILYLIFRDGELVIPAVMCRRLIPYKVQYTLRECSKPRTLRQKMNHTSSAMAFANLANILTFYVRFVDLCIFLFLRLSLVLECMSFLQYQVMNTPPNYPRPSRSRFWEGDCPRLPAGLYHFKISGTLPS